MLTDDTIHSCSPYCDRHECAAQTPLVDLLAGVPEDAMANYEESAFCSHHIPYGRLCREALSEIKKLTAERDGLRYLRSLTFTSLEVEP